MKKTLLIALLSLTTAISSLYATQSLTFSGPSTWTPGTSIVLSTTDTYSGFGGGSFGLLYWVQVNNTIAPFLSITGASFFTFIDPSQPIPVFPLSFIENAGTDPGFLTTRAEDGHTGDLGGSGPLVLDGSYHVTDVTFALA